MITYGIAIPTVKDRQNKIISVPEQCEIDTHKVRATGYGVARNDRGADAGEELFARDNLLAHQVTAALGLHLVLDVACGKTCSDVFLHGASDVCRATKTVCA